PSGRTACPRDRPDQRLSGKGWDRLVGPTDSHVLRSGREGEAGLAGDNVVGSFLYLRKRIIAGAVRSAIGDHNPVVGERDVRAGPVCCRPYGAGYGVCRASGSNGKHLDDCEIVTVRSWCNVINRHGRTVGVSGKVLALDPVSIADWSEVLMDHRLIGSERSRYGIVIVITNPEDPRIVSSRYKRGRRRPRGRACARCSADRS